MKKIKTSSVFAGSRKVDVDIYALNEDNKLVDLSRVYIVAIDKKNNVPLVFNSKRNIWGFPGGHVEKGESFMNTAMRESIEEIKKKINNCQQKFLLINKIDGEKEEKQVVCFAEIGEDCNDFADENESVKEVVYTPISEIISKVGNKDLWDPIIDELTKKI